MPAQECSESVAQLFSSVQESGKQISILGAKSGILALLSDWSPFQLLGAILPPLRHILCHNSNSKFLQAYLELLTSLFVELSRVSLSDTNVSPGGSNVSLMDALLEEVLNLSSAKNKTVRLRTCQLMCHIVARGGATHFKLGDWEERMYECLLGHTQDKIVSVRCEAIRGLAKFMNPSDTKCPCVLRILWHLEHDPSSDVRKKCLQQLPLSNGTLEQIVTRMADTSVEVKVAVFKILGENLHPKYLKVEEVMQVLKIGTADQSKGVKVAFENHFLRGWLRATEQDLIFILRRFDLIGQPETCSATLQSMFTIAPLGAISILWHELTGLDTSEPPLEGLLSGTAFEPPAISLEFSFLWLNLSKFLHSNKNYTPVCVECVDPDPVQFSEFLLRYQEHFVSRNGAYSRELRATFENLLNLLEFIDYTNESGRDRVIVSLRSLITNTEFHLSLIEPSLRHFSVVCPDVNNRIMNLATAVIALNLPPATSQAVPTQPDTQATPPRRQSEEPECGSNGHSDTSLLETSEHTQTEATDTLDKNLRSLQITNSLLQQVKIQQPDSHLLSLVKYVLIPNLLQQDFALRELALRGLGLASLTSLEMAHNVVPSFIMVATEALFLDHCSVQMAALSSLLDLFLLYGDTLFELMPMLTPDSATLAAEPEPDVAAIKQQVLSLIMRVVQSDSPELQERALVGICKLFLANRIRSCNLLGQLLIRSFHPIAHTSPALRDLIFAFFYSFCSGRQDNCALLSDSLIPTLWTVHEAPRDTFLSLVSLDSVCDKVLFFLSHQDCHNLLVEPLLALCLQNPEAESVCLSAVRCLSQADLSHFRDQVPVLKVWGSMANEFAQNSPAVTNSFLAKFQNNLKGILPDYVILTPDVCATPNSGAVTSKSTAKKGYGRSSRKVDRRPATPATPRARSTRHKNPINYTLDFSSDEDP